MKNTFICCLLLMFFVGGVAEGVAKSTDTDIGAEIITMKSATARKIAEFPHRMHQEMYVCMKCHHVNGQNMTTQKCNTCHNASMENKKLNEYRKAGHRLCRECHKLVKKEGKDAPTNCSGCHPSKIPK
jgi:hypothetical protein